MVTAHQTILSSLALGLLRCCRPRVALALCCHSRIVVLEYYCHSCVRSRLSASLAYVRVFTRMFPSLSHQRVGIRFFSVVCRVRASTSREPRKSDLDLYVNRCNARRLLTPLNRARWPCDEPQPCYVQHSHKKKRRGLLVL